MDEFKVETRERLTIPEKDALFQWGKDLWDVAKHGLTWCETDLHFLGTENGKPVSHAGIHFHTFAIDDRTIELGGLNAVITIPAARRKGYGNRVVEAAENHMRDKTFVAFGMLFCNTGLIDFYRPRGWQLIEDPVTIDQPGGPCLAPEHVMIYPLRDTAWPTGPFNLNSYPW